MCSRGGKQKQIHTNTHICKCLCLNCCDREDFFFFTYQIRHVFILGGCVIKPHDRSELAFHIL